MDIFRFPICIIGMDSNIFFALTNYFFSCRKRSVIPTTRLSKLEDDSPSVELWANGPVVSP